MEQELLAREEMSLQISKFIEQAVNNIYEEYSHEIKMILYTTVSFLFGYSAYKEYEFITRTVSGGEA